MPLAHLAIHGDDGQQNKRKPVHAAELDCGDIAMSGEPIEPVPTNTPELVAEARLSAAAC